MELKQLTEGIFYSPPDDYYDQPCLYAVVGDRGTLMVDGGVTPDVARAFIAHLRRETGKGADYAVLTHWHWDHTFGLPGIDAPVIAHANTARHIERMAGYASWSDEALEARVRSGEEISNCAMNIGRNYPGAARAGIGIRPPDIVFDGPIILDLGGLTCMLRLLPRVHTNDCVAIHVPERSVLILGDCMYANSYDRPAHYSAQAVLDLLAYIRETGAASLLDSHSLPGSLDVFWQYNSMLETAAGGVLAGISDKNRLVEHMARNAGGSLHEDAGEIAELFIAGIEYDRREREAVTCG